MKKTKDIPLSNINLDEMIHDLQERANVLRISDINKNTTLHDIFQNRGHVILFKKWPGQNIGHWITLVRQDDKYFFFDSLGKPLNYYSPQLFNILKKNHVILYQNTEKFQRDDTSVCGRYSLLIIALNKLMPFENFYYALVYLKDETKSKSYDDMLLKLIQ